MTDEELKTKIDEAHAKLVEKYGELAPSKEYFEMIVMGRLEASHGRTV